MRFIPYSVKIWIELVISVLLLQRKSTALRGDEVQFVNTVSFLHTSLKMCKKTKKTQELHCSTEGKQEYFHIHSHILCSKCLLIAALLSLTPPHMRIFQSITVEQQCQNISTEVENIPYSQTFPQILVTLCSPVLTMSFQTVQDMTEQKQINTVRLSKVLA